MRNLFVTKVRIVNGGAGRSEESCQGPHLESVMNNQAPLSRLVFQTFSFEHKAETIN